jgi:outer membrane protein assembly factor BamB
MTRKPMMMMIIACCLIAALAATTLADDWPQWRGPQRDGVWRETGLIDKFPADTIARRWTYEIASGYSGPTVADGRVYVTDYVEQPTPIERVHCVDWQSGKRLWMHEYPVDYSRISYKAGPRASVVVQDGKAYSLGAVGHLYCFDAASGDVVWQRDLDKEHSIRMPRWGIAATPVIEGGLIVTQIGGADGGCVVALDKDKGHIRWKALDDMATYAAPVVIDQAGKRIIVFALADRVVGMHAPTGEPVWAYDMPGSQWPITVSTPVVHDGMVFVTTAHVGSALLRLDEDKPAVSEVWHRNARDGGAEDTLHSLIPTPVIRDGHIYGTHGQGELRCLALMTGKRVWEDDSLVPRGRFATMHLVEQGDRVWVFNERGELIIAKLSPAGVQEISRAKLIDPTTAQSSQRGGVTWSHPAFAYKHVFARNDRELVCADLAAKGE